MKNYRARRVNTQAEQDLEQFEASGQKDFLGWLAAQDFDQERADAVYVAFFAKG